MEAPDLGSEHGVIAKEITPGKATTRRYSEAQKEQQIAADFTSFVADLASIDGSEPSVLTEAWIDPSLLAELDGGEQ